MWSRATRPRGRLPQAFKREHERGARAYIASAKRCDYLFEHSAPVLVVLELVEAGAGWSQQHNVSGCGDRSGPSQRGFQGLGVVNFHSFNLRLDLVRGRADGVDPLHPLPQQLVELRVVAVFIFAPQESGGYSPGTIPVP